jgi:hypothetical protein
LKWSFMSETCTQKAGRSQISNVPIDNFPKADRRAVAH